MRGSSPTIWCQSLHPSLYIGLRKRGPTSAVRSRCKVADTLKRSQEDGPWLVRSCDSFEGCVYLDIDRSIAIFSVPCHDRLRCYPLHLPQQRDTEGGSLQDIRPSQLHVYLLPKLDHYSFACIVDMSTPGVRTKGVFSTNVQSPCLPLL